MILAAEIIGGILVTLWATGVTIAAIWWRDR